MTVTHRDILRILSDLGECTTRMILDHADGATPRQGLSYYLIALRDFGCVAERKMAGEASKRWSITPRGGQWLTLLDASGQEMIPPSDLSRALTMWLMEYPGEHRTSEIEGSPEIIRVLEGYSASSAVPNALRRMWDKGFICRRTSTPGGSGRPGVLWSIIDTVTDGRAPSDMLSPAPATNKKIPRQAPPGWWDEHWQEIEEEIRRVMTGRRPMLLVTLKREIRTESYPQGLIREAVARGLISTSWSRGQQYYTLVG